MDIGHTHTEFIVSKGNQIFVVRSVNFGGSMITEIISRYLNIPQTEAEEIKIHQGCIITQPELAEDEAEWNLSNIILPQVNLIVNEIKKTVMIAKNEFQIEIDKILLTGGAARLKYLKEYIAKETQIDTGNFIPFFLEGNTNQMLLDEVDFYVTALGGSIQEFFPPYYHLCFNHSMGKKKDVLNYLWIINLALVICIGLGLHIYISSTVHHIEKEKTALNTELQQVSNEAKYLANQLNGMRNELSSINEEKNNLFQLQTMANDMVQQKIQYFDYFKIIRGIVPTTLQLDEMTFESKKVTVKGTSPNFSDLGLFIKELEFQGSFKNITFNYEEKDNPQLEYVLKVIQFKIEAEIP